jgi:hypothetical protein
MYARVATFENDDPAAVEGAIARLRQNIAAGMPEMPELAGVKFLLLADRTSGRMMGIALFESEEALRRGDAVMNAGPGAAGRRSAVEFYEVPVHTLD